MLYQLPINGNWVDPTMIRRVVFLRGERWGAIETMPRVVVHLAAGEYEVIECDLTEAALRIRDEIAAVANAPTSPEPQPAARS